MAGADVVPDRHARRRAGSSRPTTCAAHLTPRSRVLVLCTPSNPTGAVYSDAELAALAEVARRHRLAVIVDEIYARISYVPVGRWLRAAPQLADRS